MEAEGQVEKGRPVGGGVAFIEVEVGVGATEGKVGKGGGVGVVEGVGEEGSEEGKGGGVIFEKEKGFKGGTVGEIVFEGEEDAFGVARGAGCIDDDARIGRGEDGFEFGFREEGKGGRVNVDLRTTWLSACSFGPKNVFDSQYHYSGGLGLHGGDLLWRRFGMREDDLGLTALNLEHDAVDGVRVPINRHRHRAHHH